MRYLAVAAALLASAICCGSGPARADGQGSQRISAARIVGLAKNAIRSVQLGGGASLVQASSISDQIVGVGTPTLVVGSPLVTPSFVNVPIELDLNGHFLRTVFVGYRVQRYVTTAVAAHDLAPGTVLAASDMTMARVVYNGQRTNGTPVLVGRRILSAFRAGQQLSIEETQSNQIVKPGASVVLIVHDDGVSVVAEVVARTSGGLGDQVSVYNPDTNKTLTGTVIGPDRVELNIGGAQ